MTYLLFHYAVTCRDGPDFNQEVEKPTARGESTLMCSQAFKKSPDSPVLLLSMIWWPGNEFALIFNISLPVLYME